ncbi:transglycosylase domain-containing protein [Fulvivirgaceae bacterium PWU4]|uniref:Transglycosylase domain-containing protein n=1 Tax=Chryseosolibacter histidini TaxID=2782349 RepID=A0AAP2DM02_9BACT|nr:transglycosylase domain-containing protein [Chryseosolibacter histidini]MBT1698741.1 transglycosylase domain-containing protein [Chryseosolibacter histidini]
MHSSLARVVEGYRKIRSFINSRIRPLRNDIGSRLSGLSTYLKAHRKLRSMLIIAGVPFLFLLILMSVVYYESPGKKTLRAFRNAIPSEVYTSDGVLIGRYFVQERTPVKYEDISPSVIDAAIATEDVRFFNHDGVDYRSLGRVLIKSILLQNESSGGGSTITQQLAKNIFPRREYMVLSMIINKLREAVIAGRLESIYSKKEILTLYLNTIPFGDNTYGIQAAAQRFFSCDAKALTADQAAVLIGMLKATHNYNPRLFPKQSRTRRNVVLAQMKKYGLLAKDRTDSLQKLPLKLKLGELRKDESIAPYFRDYLKTELQKWCEENRKADGTPYNLQTDGLKIYTTIDSKLQRYAERAVVRQMTTLQQQFFDHWGKEEPWKGNESVITDAIKRTGRYKNLRQRGLSEEEVMRELGKPVSMRLFTWDGGKQAKVSPIDSIKHHLQYLNAGFIAMEPATGKIKAWVGGIDHDYFQYDHVKISTKRQVGSVFKPIVYAQAIEEGVSPCEFIPAGQQTYIDEEGQEWTPRNSQYDYPVQYSMRGALAYSVNTVSVKLISRAGIDNTIRLARNMGIQSEIPDVPSIALGSSAISLVEMTAAYACLANEGITKTPFFIAAIEDREGNIYKNIGADETGKRALSQETAQLVRHMLQTVVHEGTASRLRWKYGVYNDVAAKTGTTQANADGWFMAMTPKLVMGTWVGADDPRIRFRHTLLGQGSNTALPVAAYFLKEVNNDPSYKEISRARFPVLPPVLSKKLSCDLYELDDNLLLQIEKSVRARDSVIHADTLVAPPPETFLQTLYNRKRKIAGMLSETNDDTEPGMN